MVIALSSLVRVRVRCLPTPHVKAGAGPDVGEAGESSALTATSAFTDPVLNTADHLAGTGLGLSIVRRAVHTAASRAVLPAGQSAAVCPALPADWSSRQMSGRRCR
jgi:hypothetical protein